MRPALKDFIPIRSQDPSFAGWCWFDFFLFFFMLGREIDTRFQLTNVKNHGCCLCSETRGLGQFSAYLNPSTGLFGAEYSCQYCPSPPATSVTPFMVTQRALCVF